MRISWRWLAGLVLLCAALVGVSSALAQGAEKRVTVLRRDGDITLRADGSTRVVETWVVQFIGGPFRYAFRTFNLDKVDGFSDFQVLEDGQPYQLEEARLELPHTYTVDNNPYLVEVYWYFPETTDTVRVFQLAYTAQGVVRVQPEGDEFYWKFIEFDRKYPIEQSEVTVHLPADVPLDQLRMATYRNTYLEKGTVEVLDDRTVVFRGTNFEPYEEWEVRLALPPGLVDFPKPTWQMNAEEYERWLAEREFRRSVGWVADGLLLVVGLIALFLLWFLRGRDRWIVPWVGAATHPPSDLSPAVVGVLLDRRVDMQDVLATIIDLARRGYLRIQAEESNWRFIRLAPEDGERALLPFERRLLSILFGKERESRLTDVAHRFRYRGQGLYRQIEAQAVRDGLFARSPHDIRRRMRWQWLLGSLLLLVVAVIAGPLRNPDYFWIKGAGLGLLAVVGGFSLAWLLLLPYLVPRTRAGAREAARWRAFRRYLQRLERYTNLHTAQVLFEQYLPYAVAMGVQKSWVRKFAAMQTPAPRWYTEESLPAEVLAMYADEVVQGPPVLPDGGLDALLESGGRAQTTSASPPALDAAAQSAFRSLEQISDGLFAMMNTAARKWVLHSPASSSSGGRSGGSSGGGWSSGTTLGSSSSSSSSSSGGSWSSGGGGSGGGSSGFG